MTSRMRVAITVNGDPHQLSVDPRQTLLQTLRRDLCLTGTKSGCNVGSCGTCTVLVNNVAVRACLLLSVTLEGCEVKTVEGLAPTPWTLHPLQRAFIDYHGFQCGFCTPGMLMAAYALLKKDPHPTADQIREALSGQLCRCTGYTKIVDAVLAVSEGEYSE